MLESVDLTRALSKSAARSVLRTRQDRLFDLAELSFERKFPVIIVFEGWDASGKGTTIRKLTQKLDPRGFKVLPTRAPMPHERNKPWLWRFWMNIPRHGQMAIFDRSWYGRVMVERVEGLTAIPDWIRAYEEINAFERTLAADGTVFVKFFLHISKAEQLRRFVKLTQQPETAWQVTADDWEQHRRYDDYVRAVADMLANTSTPLAPWEVVPATNKEYCQYVVFQTVIRRLEAALGLEPSPEPVLDVEEETTGRERAERKARKAEKAAAKEAARAGKKGKKKRQTAKAAAVALVDGQHDGLLQAAFPTAPATDVHDEEVDDA
jgi:AMP-polyphosphate phosphotransferase